MASSPAPKYSATFFDCAVPVAISNFTSGCFFASATTAGWKPNDVAKMNAAASASGRTKPSFLFLMFSSLLSSGAARDYRTVDRRFLGEARKGPGEDLDSQLDIFRGRLLLRRMTDPAVEAA